MGGIQPSTTAMLTLSCDVWSILFAGQQRFFEAITVLVSQREIEGGGTTVPRSASSAAHPAHQEIAMRIKLSPGFGARLRLRARQPSASPRRKPKRRNPCRRMSRPTTINDVGLSQSASAAVPY